MLERFQARLIAGGLIDVGLFRIDGTVIRAAQAAAGTSKYSSRRAGGSRPGPLPGGFGTKVHPCRPAKLAGDEGCSHPRIRRWLARDGIKAVIPRDSDQRPDDKRVRFGENAYKRRSVASSAWAG